MIRSRIIESILPSSEQEKSKKMSLDSLSLGHVIVLWTELRSPHSYSEVLSLVPRKTGAIFGGRAFKEVIKVK